MESYIERFSSLGYKDYYEYISENVNKKKLDILTFNIPCGNSIEEDGSIIDLTLSKIVDYNIDDFVIFFNNGVYHAFTPPEFGDLLKKEINPYNRTPMPVFNNIIENMRFRKKAVRYLSNRGVVVKLDKTMKERGIWKKYKKEDKEDLNFFNIDG